LAADDLLSILDNHKPSLSETDFENLGFYVRWLCSILRDRSMKIGRICSFLSSVPVFLDALSDEGIICKLSKSEFTEIAASTMSLYYAPGIRSAIKKFSEYVKFECEDFDMPDWQYTKELFKKNIPSPKPLIDYSDIKSVIALMNLRAALFGCPDCEYIKIFIYLGVYAGMRVMEIANLRLHNVIYDDGIVICVRATKTENGVRNIHLSKLAPAWVVDAFLAYFKGRRGSCTDMNDLIFVQSNGEPLVTKQVSSRVAKYFKDGGMANIRFHFLRHQFQNFFMLRWIYAFHPDVIPPDAPFLQFELFDKANIENFKKYFLGLGDVKRGQEQFTHALAVLSRTVGHAFCSVTESAYLHNIAWLFYLLSKRWDKKDVSVTTQQMQDLLQLSYYKLPDQFKGRGKKTFKQGEIVQAQSLDLKPFYKTGLSKTNKG
ncbi:MAG TPA: tyrosine-type recombinase/integrase, partial [Nitrospirota bacterium]|nr:tyrosine-type recombinase/integrase [Nitrospirota bacterium]